MALSRPTRIEVNGAAAYAVFPGSLALMAPDGDLVSHGTLTFTLHGGSDRWLIETLVWSGAEPAPA